MDQQLLSKRTRLLARLKELESCVVAFSAGVDSAVVAKAAYLALADRAVAVTGVSPSLAAGELETAREVARQIGIRHEVVNTNEWQKTEYQRNAPDRCFHCKTELYHTLSLDRSKWNVQVVLNGANLDDLDDYRPGMRAAKDYQVLSPLAEVGLTKAEVRQLARDWGLSVWDKPATPCLSSRIAYGQEVTPERLQRIDHAERWLRERGMGELRVRLHADELARIEVGVHNLPRFAESEFRERLVAEFQRLGFKFVTLDLMGFRSGSLNQLVPLDSLLPEKRSNGAGDSLETRLPTPRRT